MEEKQSNLPSILDSRPPNWEEDKLKTYPDVPFGNRFFSGYEHGASAILKRLLDEGIIYPGQLEWLQ